MNEHVLLVDLENIQRFDLGQVPLDARIKIFVGQLQSKLLDEGICKNPTAKFVILSNDKGFDPLVWHLVARGFKCRRDGQARATPAPSSPLPEHAQAVADLLKRSEKNKRPRKRATLTNYLSTDFNKKLTEAEIKQAIEYLLEAGLIAGSEAALTYNF